MDIGTAKISKEEMHGIPHFNLSLLDIDEEDNVKKFTARAEQWEKELENDYPFVIYAGGSTLYIQNLLFPVDDVPPSNPKRVEKLKQEIEKTGIASFYEKLLEVDPDYAATMDGKNTQRIIRALDVYYETGQPFSSFHNRNSWEKPLADYVFGLHLEREILYGRINKRVDEMFHNGLENELSKLLDTGITKDAQALQTVGYKEIIEGRDQGLLQNEYKELIKRNSRRYAKRQLTFFKRWPCVQWLDVTNHTTDSAADSLYKLIEKASE